jgi:LysM repeat protein
MTPFGPESGYLIHVVQAGESYLSIADLYGTTPAVLQGVNPTVEGASLWVGRQIVIPVGVTSLGSLPQFVVVFTTETVNINALADFYGSDPEQIRFYNQLGADDLVPSGRWLIIPLLAVTP